MNDFPNDSQADSSPVPRPAWWQAALTRLVLTVFGLVLTTAYGLFLLFIRQAAKPGPDSPNPFAIVGLAIMVLALLIVFLPVKWQYRGSFRGDAAAAFKASLVWYAVAAILVVAAVASLHPPAIAKVVPLAAVLAGFGYANHSRHGQLERHYAEHPESRPQKATHRTARLWTWILCGAIAVAAIVRWLP